jgi:hypothetical protein
MGRERLHEAAALAAASWMAQHGLQHGFRTPTAQERARATGRGSYLLALRISERQLYDLAYNVIEPQIERITGVASATVGGGRQREITVRAHRDALRQRGLTVLDLLAAVAYEHAPALAGKRVRWSVDGLRRRNGLEPHILEHDEIAVDLLDQKVQKTVCDMLKRIENEHLDVNRVFHPYLETLALIKKAATPLPEGFHEKALSALENISQKLAQYPKKTLCHLDLHRKNILRKGDRLFFIDWEYAAMSHPYHTLASMASIERWSDEMMWCLAEAL